MIFDKPVAPTGYFFRVCKPDRDGDVRVELHKIHSRWYNPRRSVAVDRQYVIKRDTADWRKAVERVMRDLLIRKEITDREASITNALVGDYPPKEI